MNKKQYTHRLLSAFLALSLIGIILLSGCSGDASGGNSSSEMQASQGEENSAVSSPVVSKPESVPSSSSPPESTVSSETSGVESRPVSSEGVTVSSSPPPVNSQPGGVPYSEPTDPSYFDDAVFVGDSVSLKLKYYVTNQRKGAAPNLLGKAQFLTSGSLGSANSLWPVSDQSVHPSYNNVKMRIEDAVAQMGAKKIFIMLGVNDIGLYGIDDSIKNMKTLIGLILEKSPDVTIFVQSATPMVRGKELRDLNNRNLLEYDNKLKAMCDELGYYFVDVASVMRDSEGFLPLEYCSDPSGENSLGIHFTDKACQVWIDYLETHTVQLE